MINKSKSETTILGIVILFDYMFRPFLIRPSSGRRYFVEETVKFIQSVPLQAWSGPEGSRKLRFPDFMTTAKEGGKVVILTHRPHLPPGNSPGTHFC